MNRRDVLAGALGALSAIRVSAASKPIVLDAHAHVGAMSSFGVPDVPFDDFLAAAAQAGIDKMCVSAIETTYDADIGNRETWKWAKRYPDRLIPFAAIPYAQVGRKGLDALDRAVHDWGFKGFGELETDASDPIDHPYWIAVLERAAALKIPVLVHGSQGPCARAAARVPEAAILLAHLGTGLGLHQGEWVDAILMAKSHPNVYLETCTSMVPDGMVEMAVREIGAARVVFGTDSPLLDPAVQLAKVTSAEIPEAAKRMILGENMRRLLRL